MTEQTGIDLPGEASLKDAYWSREKMTNVDLAVASFGQRFEVTPLQMITAFAATLPLSVTAVVPISPRTGVCS